MDIKIEKINESSFDQFYDLFEKSVRTQFPEYSKKTTEWIISNSRGHNRERTKKEILDNAFVALGAFHGKSIKGFIFGLMPWGGISFVYWLGVDPEFQKKGIGSALLKEWENLVRDKGAHAIHLDSAEWNLKFYEKMGFEVIGHDLNGYFGAEDYILKKLIQKPKEENYLK